MRGELHPLILQVVGNTAAPVPGTQKFLGIVDHIANPRIEVGRPDPGEHLSADLIRLKEVDQVQAFAMIIQAVSIGIGDKVDGRELCAIGRPDAHRGRQEVI